MAEPTLKETITLVANFARDQRNEWVGKKAVYEQSQRFAEAVAEGVKILDKVEEITAREQALASREAEVNDKEAAVSAREAAVSERESRLHQFSADIQAKELAS